MIKILFQVVGLIVAVWGVVALWPAFEAIDKIRGAEDEMIKLTSERARPGSSKAAVDKGIAEQEQAIGKKRVEMYVWFGLAAGGIILGLCMALLPPGRKRKVPAGEPAPEPKQQTPEPNPAAAPSPGPEG
jgi:hypothetical protein